MDVVELRPHGDERNPCRDFRPTSMGEPPDCGARNFTPSLRLDRIYSRVERVNWTVSDCEVFQGRKHALRQGRGSD
jgi:hypothetical protein